MLTFWKLWALDALNRAWRSAQQTAVPVLVVALQTGQLTGLTAAKSLTIGVVTSVAVVVGRLLLAEVLQLRLPVTSPAWAGGLVRAASAAVVPVAAVWPLSWSGFSGIEWTAVGFSSLLAALLSLIDFRVDPPSMPTIGTGGVTPDPAVDEGDVPAVAGADSDGSPGDEPA